MVLIKKTIIFHHFHAVKVYRKHISFCLLKKEQVLLNHTKTHENNLLSLPVFSFPYLQSVSENCRTHSPFSDRRNLAVCGTWVQSVYVGAHRDRVAFHAWVNHCLCHFHFTHFPPLGLLTSLLGNLGSFTKYLTIEGTGNSFS